MLPAALAFPVVLVVDIAETRKPMLYRQNPSLVLDRLFLVETLSEDRIKSNVQAEVVHTAGLSQELTEVTVAALLTERLAKMVRPTHRLQWQAMADGQQARKVERVQQLHRLPFLSRQEQAATEATAAEALVLVAML